MDVVIFIFIIIFIVLILFVSFLKMVGKLDNGPTLLIYTVLFIGLGALYWADSKCKNDAVIFSSEKLQIYSTELNAETSILWRKGNSYLYRTGDSISGFTIESVPIDKTTILYTNEAPHILMNYCIKIMCGDTLRRIEEVKIYLPYESIIHNY